MSEEVLEQIDNEIDQTKLDLEPVIESLIFVHAEPLAVEKIVELLQNADVNVQNNAVKKVLKSLMEKWQDPERNIGRGICLKNIGGAYAFTTIEKNAQFVKKIIKEKPITLSKGQMEVLSIVAYRQPITRVDIDEIRGVDSSFALKRLMQLKLLKILGKSEGLGRPLLYGTSKYFLEFFALNSLNDLPTLNQYESLDDGEAKNENLDSDRIDLKDLFEDAKKRSMFSNDVKRLSEEALKSLDEALLRVDEVKKSLSNDEADQNA